MIVSPLYPRSRSASSIVYDGGTVADALDAQGTAMEAGNAAYGVVSYHEASTGLSLNLTGGTFGTLTDGAIVGDSADITYDSGTGIVTVGAGGVFLVDFSASARRVGITSVDTTLAVFANGAETVISTRETLASVGTLRVLTGRAPLRLGAGDTISLRAKTSASVEIEVMDYLLSLFWLAA